MTEQYTISKDDMRTLQIWSGAYISLAMTHKIIDFDKGMEMIDKLHRIAVMPDTARKEPSVEKDAVLDISVEELDVSIRTSRCLRIANMQTIRDLLESSLSELYRQPNFGLKCCKELYEELLIRRVRMPIGDNALVVRAAKSSRERLGVKD